MKIQQKDFCRVFSSFCTSQRAQADDDIGDDDDDDGDDDDDAGGCCFRTSQRRFRPVVEVGNKGRSIRALQINSAYRSPFNDSDNDDDEDEKDNDDDDKNDDDDDPVEVNWRGAPLLVPCGPAAQ